MHLLVRRAFRARERMRAFETETCAGAIQGKVTLRTRLLVRPGSE